MIKVTTREFDLTDAIYVGSSRGKEALALDLKHPRGQEIARRLIERADVVHHNMRTGVAERLGIGYEQARAINPAIVYCHTRGFERDGPRTPLPGNDQMGHALAGTAYEAGGTHHGTPPIWQMTAYGDTGNGILSAAAVIQALRHRDRTGEGQFVHTSILNVCMLFNSSTYADPTAAGPSATASTPGSSASRRCAACTRPPTAGCACSSPTTSEWRRLCEALDAATSPPTPASPTPRRRRADDAELAAAVGSILAGKDAEHWSRALDGPGAVRDRLGDVRPRAVRRPRHAPPGLGRPQRARRPRHRRARRHAVLLLGLGAPEPGRLAGHGPAQPADPRAARLRRRRDRRARRRRRRAGAVAA